MPTNMCIIIITLEPHYNTDFGVHSEISATTVSVIMRVLYTLSIGSGREKSHLYCYITEFVLTTMYNDVAVYYYYYVCNVM